MRGNVFTQQVFTLLRELTATDYQKGVNCNCFTSMDHAKWDWEQHISMNRASKEGGMLIAVNQYTEPHSARNLKLPILKQWKERMTVANTCVS